MSSSPQADPPRRGGLAWAAFAAAPPMLLYALTVCRTVYVGYDSCELATCLAAGGVAHPPGYPLYLLLGKLLLPLFPGRPALAANLYSALLATVAAVLVFETVRRATGDRPAALLAAWTTAAGTTQWQMATVAEVTALQGALEVGLFLAAWQGSAATVAVSLAACLCNHPVTVVAAPGALLLLVSRPGARLELRRNPVRHLALLILPGLLYGYLPFQSRAAHAGLWVEQLRLDLFRPADLAWYMLLKGYPKDYYNYAPSHLIVQWQSLVALLLANFGAAGLAAGFLGARELARRDRMAASGLLLMILAQCAFYSGFTAYDRDSMYAPAFVLVGVPLGVGFHALLSQFGASASRRAGVFLVLAAAAPGWQVVSRFAERDLSRYVEGEAWGREALLQMRPGSIFISGWQGACLLDYLTSAVGWKPRVQARCQSLEWAASRERVSRPFIDLLTFEEVDRTVAGWVTPDTDVYTDLGTPEFASRVDRQVRGRLFKLSRRPAPAALASVPSAWPTTILTSVASVDLVSMTIAPPVLAAGELGRLTLRWRFGEHRLPDMWAKVYMADAASGAQQMLGQVGLPYQSHRVGVPLPAGTAAAALEECFDFTPPRKESYVPCPPGRYVLGVGLGSSLPRIAADVEVR